MVDTNTYKTSPDSGINQTLVELLFIYLSLLDSPTSSIILCSEQTLYTPVFYSALEVPQLLQGPDQYSLSTVHTAGKLPILCLPHFGMLISLSSLIGIPDP